MKSIERWFEKNAGRPMRRSDKVIAVILIAVFLFVFYVVLDANKYRAQVRVIEGEGKVGVNPTAEYLDFGDLSRGTSAVRRVSLENRTWTPMYIMIWKTGEIDELVDINKNYFKLASGGSEKIELSVYIPASGEIGKTYRGRVYLFKIPTLGL